MMSGFEITEVIFNLHSVNHQFGKTNESKITIPSNSNMYFFYL